MLCVLVCVCQCSSDHCNMNMQKTDAYFFFINLNTICINFFHYLDLFTLQRRLIHVKILNFFFLKIIIYLINY